MPPEPERFPHYTISYGQFLGALTVMTLVVVIGYLVLVVAGQRELAEMREKLAEVRTEEKAHIQQADVWIARIKKLEDQVEGLITHPAARKDPFTGTQGTELERRIQALEELGPALQQAQ